MEKNTGNECSLCFYHPLLQSTQKSECFLWWAHKLFLNSNHRGLQPCFPTENEVTSGSSFASWKFHLFCQKAAFVLIPLLLMTDFFDKLPMCVGRDRKMEEANGEMSFRLFRLMYTKYTSDTSSALPAGVPAGGHWLSMYSASYQAT